jgi:hypothetical protein
VKAKLEKVLAKGYIELVDIELVEAMMFMFHVDKGANNIRLVYDGTRSGLNESVYAPWFALPTIDSMTRWVIAGAWLTDNDYGEIFLNCPLHPPGLGKILWNRFITALSRTSQGREGLCNRSVDAECLGTLRIAICLSSRVPTSEEARYG